LIDHPTLADMARVEWALHHSAALPDAETDTASWQLLASHDPERLRLQLASATQVIHSEHALAAALLQAGLTPTEASTDADTHAQQVLIWRQGYKPCWRAIGMADAAFTQALAQGLSLAHALEQTLLVHPDFDFQAWLTQAAHSGLLIAAMAFTPGEGTT
jgi:hypothetical protein